MADGREHVTSHEGQAVPPPKLSADELREVLRTRNDIPLRDFAVTVMLVFVPPLAMYLWPSIWVGFLCALLSVHTFNRCAQFVHNSGHDGLFSNRRLNKLVGNIAGFFVGYVQQGHRETHNEHHLYLNSDRDPDRIWCEPEAQVSSVIRNGGRDLLLITAAIRFLQYIPGRHGRSRRSEQPRRTAHGASLAKLSVSFLPVAAIQILVLLVYVAAAEFVVVAGIEYYLLIYILPLFVLYPLQIRLRSNVEHSYPPGYRCLRPEDVGVVRSIKPHWLEKLIIAPLYIEYHFEHHCFPTMPYYNATKLRSILASKGFAPPTAHGYVRFMWRKRLAERELTRRARAA